MDKGNFENSYHIKLLKYFESEVFRLFSSATVFAFQFSSKELVKLKSFQLIPAQFRLK